jgi:hypothetical protein
VDPEKHIFPLDGKAVYVFSCHTSKVIRVIVTRCALGETSVDGGPLS